MVGLDHVVPFHNLLEVAHISLVEQREVWKLVNHHEHDDDFILIQLVQLQ
jgi:hypothetical protein